MKLPTDNTLWQKSGRKMIPYTKAGKKEVKALMDQNDNLRRKLQKFIDATENLKKVEGRYHTQLAVERLFKLLPRTRKPANLPEVTRNNNA